VEIERSRVSNSQRKVQRESRIEYCGEKRIDTVIGRKERNIKHALMQQPGERRKAQKKWKGFKGRDKVTLKRASKSKPMSQDVLERNFKMTDTTKRC